MQKVPGSFALMPSPCADCTGTVPKHLHMQTGGVWMAACLDDGACQLQAAFEGFSFVVIWMLSFWRGCWVYDKNNILLKANRELYSQLKRLKTDEFLLLSQKKGPTFDEGQLEIYFPLLMKPVVGDFSEVIKLLWIRFNFTSVTNAITFIRSSLPSNSSFHKCFPQYPHQHYLIRQGGLFTSESYALSVFYMFNNMSCLSWMSLGIRKFARSMDQDESAKQIEPSVSLDVDSNLIKCENTNLIAEWGHSLAKIGHIQFSNGLIQGLITQAEDTNCNYPDWQSSKRKYNRNQATQEANSSSHLLFECYLFINSLTCSFSNLGGTLTQCICVCNIREIGANYKACIKCFYASARIPIWESHYTNLAKILGWLFFHKIGVSPTGGLSSAFTTLYIPQLAIYILTLTITYC
ncbi:hypothetical protein VP01_3548g1 [Puccinia sorghi]|uniref:Uncharacterized protein n=1 Tax=Puccinia sorghi TaxID=27349 RepID=A0A0L6UVF9_9BASI|nr:hypothetical protein VP01_3548g1 [Puccinia sorghi]